MRGILATTVCLLLSSAGVAAERFDDEWVSTLELQFVGERVHRGLERGGRSAGAKLAVSRGAFDAEFGASVSEGAPRVNEASARASWTWEAFESLEFAAGVSAGSFFSRPPGAPASSVEGGIELAWRPRSGAQPSISWFRDVRLDVDTVELALDWSFPLTKLGTFLDTRSYAGWSDGRDWRRTAAGGRVSDAYGYWGADLLLPYRIGEITTIVAGLHYSEAYQSARAGVLAGTIGRRNLWASVGVTLDF